mmetsp:Transcript_64702/g.74328  ORF Transcript_64702/g.74328 Transcript_64702/m.74328 type:complete len:83 (-) Transcript_64702:386-634(-)
MRHKGDSETLDQNSTQSEENWKEDYFVDSLAWREREREIKNQKSGGEIRPFRLPTREEGGFATKMRSNIFFIIFQEHPNRYS